MEQFFARRREGHAKLKKRETPEARSSRRAREQYNASRPIPGKKGPSVFYWCDVDGFRIRTPLPRSQVESFWGRWKTTEKIYNGFDNCWDCCTLFGDSMPGEPEDSNSDSDESPTAPMKQMNASSSDYCMAPSTVQSVEKPDANSSSPAVSHPRSPENPSPLCNSTIKCSQAEALQPPPTSMHPTSADCDALPLEDANKEDMETDNLFDASSKDVLAANMFHCVAFTNSGAQNVEDLIYYRFGFSLNERPYSGVPPSIISIPFSSWEEVTRAVGGQKMQSSGTNQHAISDFLGCLLSTADPLRDVPGKYWDLSAEGADPLTHSVTKFIRIEKCRFQDDAWYLLRRINLHPSRDTSWMLAVDAMTALECIRRGLGPHTLDIANHFINYGIPFLTLSYLRPASTTSHAPKYHPQLTRQLLGRRPKDYIFNLADYAAYTTLRGSYLLSHPHARAALCAGGVIARLAREEMSHITALSGPSEAALNGEQRVLTSDGDHFCDDKISDQVMDLICGVYEVETGNKGEATYFIYISFPINIFPGQVSLVSWFPRQAIWLGSGLSVGQWTYECEKWYTN